MAAALRIVDRRGLDALTMRGVGEALGYEAMSLYKHVPGKQALLDLVIERVASEMEPPDASASWDDQLRQLAGEWRRIALAHPHVFPLLATGPPPSPAALLPIIEATLAALREPAVDDESATSMFWAFLAYTTGALMAECAATVSHGTLSRSDPAGSTPAISPTSPRSAPRSRPHTSPPSTYAVAKCGAASAAERGEVGKWPASTTAGSEHDRVPRLIVAAHSAMSAPVV